jgi:hypothetical protein
VEKAKSVGHGTRFEFLKTDSYLHFAEIETSARCSSITYYESRDRWASEEKQVGKTGLVMGQFNFFKSTFRGNNKESFGEG